MYLNNDGNNDGDGGNGGDGNSNGDGNGNGNSKDAAAVTNCKNVDEDDGADSRTAIG